MDGKSTLHQFLLSFGQPNRVSNTISLTAAGQMTIVIAPTSLMSEDEELLSQIRHAGMQREDSQPTISGHPF